MSSMYFDINPLNSNSFIIIPYQLVILKDKIGYVFIIFLLFYMF